MAGTPMRSGRWKRIEDVYESARAQPPEGREAFLKAACQDDGELRREVEALLRQDEPGGLLDRPAWDGEEDASCALKRSLNRRWDILSAYGAAQRVSVARQTDPMPPGAQGRIRCDTAPAMPPAKARSPAPMEARAIAALNHPHVCALHDIGPDYRVMEYVEGETLAERLRRGPLKIDAVLRYGARIAGALAAAHARGIVQRDLKPANVMGRSRRRMRP